MTSDEQMRIITNWTRGARVSPTPNGWWYGRVSFTDGIVQHVGPYRVVDQVIGTCYELVRASVWSIVDEA